MTADIDLVGMDQEDSWPQVSNVVAQCAHQDILLNCFSSYLNVRLMFLIMSDNLCYLYILSITVICPLITDLALIQLKSVPSICGFSDIK